MRLGLLSTARINEKLAAGAKLVDEVELSAIASRDLARAQAQAAELGVERAHGSYEELLADPDVDAVYIALPNAMHAAWALKALTAGKHVLCEKPLTLSAADTVTLYETAKAVDRHLGEAFMWPHHPRSQRLRELVAKGDLGPLVGHQATFTFALDRPTDHRFDARGGGALLDGGIYCVGPALCLTDAEPAEVAARAAHNTAGVDVAMDGWVALGTWGASFTVSMVAPGRRNQTVICRDGVVVVDNHFPGPERPGVLTVVRADGSRDEVAQPLRPRVVGPHEGL